MGGSASGSAKGQGLPERLDYKATISARRNLERDPARKGGQAVDGLSSPSPPARRKIAGRSPITRRGASIVHNK